MYIYICIYTYVCVQICIYAHRHIDTGTHLHKKNSKKNKKIKQRRTMRGEQRYSNKELTVAVLFIVGANLKYE